MKVINGGPLTASRLRTTKQGIQKENTEQACFFISWVEFLPSCPEADEMVPAGRGSNESTEGRMDKDFFLGWKLKMVVNNVADMKNISWSLDFLSNRKRQSYKM